MNVVRSILVSPLQRQVPIRLLISSQEGVAYLHEHGVVHRDLKPENLLYLEPDGDELVIADFGIAKHVSGGEQLTSVAGSPGYAAPEVLQQTGHGKAVDLWSVGVISYTLLCGYTPFRASETKALLDECAKGRIEFHDRYWKNIHQEAKDFISALIRPNPDERPTAQEALNLPVRLACFALSTLTGAQWLTVHKPSTEHDLSTGLRDNWCVPFLDSLGRGTNQEQERQATLQVLRQISHCNLPSHQGWTRRRRRSSVGSPARL